MTSLRLLSTPDNDVEKPTLRLLGQNKPRGATGAWEEEKQLPLAKAGLVLGGLQMGAGATPFPHDDAVIAALRLGVAGVSGAYALHQFVKNKGPEAFQGLVQEGKMQFGEMVSKMTTKEKHEFMPTDVEAKPGGFEPALPTEKLEGIKPAPPTEKLGGIEAEAQPYVPEAVLAEAAGGYFQTPSGISKTPPFVPEPTPDITTLLKAEGASAEPLEVDARKYKTADEFIASQGKVLFHNTYTENVAKIEKEGFKKDFFGSAYFAENIKAAENYPFDYAGEDLTMLEVVVPEKLLGRPEETPDGIEYEVKGTGNIKLKTKSQLTDIWHKAHQPKDGILPKEEVAKVDQADTTIAEPKIVKARVDSLISDVNAISKQMTSLEKVKQQLVAKNVSTAQVDNQLEDLSKKFTYIDSQIAELMTEEVTTEDIAKAKGQMKIGDILKGEERAEIKGVRLGKEVGITQQKAHYKEMAIKAKIRSQVRGRTKKMLNDIKSVDVKHMRPEFAGVVSQIRDNLDFAVPTQKTLGKLWSRKEYLEEYPDANLPDYALDELSRLEKMNRNDLTMDHLESLHMTVMHAAHLSKYKNELLFKKVARDTNTAIEEAVENISKRKIKTTEQEYDIDVTREETKTGLLRQIFTVKSCNAELNSEILDKEENGIIKKLLYDNIDDGVNDSLSYIQGVKDKWNNFINASEINLDGWSEYFDKDKKIDWQIIELSKGKTLKITKANRIEFYMNTLNEKNNAHLMEGGYAFERNPTVINTLTEEDKQLILNSVTEEEKAIATALKEIVYDPQHPAINKPYLTINGYSVGKEDNYLRIKVAGITLPKEIKGLHKHISQAALEEMGMLEERQNAKNPIIIGDIFKTTYESIRNASTFIGLAVPIRDAKTLLYSQRFETMLRQTYGEAWHKFFDTYLEDVVGSMVRMDDVEKLVSTTKDKLAVALLGLNPFVWLYQPTSYLGASTEISSKYLTVASRRMATKERLEKWMSRSPQLRERIEGGFSRDVAEVGNIGAVRGFWTGKQSLSDHAMGGIKNFDTKTIIRICEACEIEQSELGYTGDDLAVRATTRAEEVIRKTQPTFHAKDRSEISRSRNPFVRALTMFTSQRNKNFIIQRRSIEKYGRSPKKPKDKATLIWALLVTSIIQYNIVRGWRELRRKLINPKKDKRPDKKTTIFVRDWLGAVLGNFYGGSSFASSLASKIQNGSYAGYDMETPLSSLVGTGVDAVSDITRGVEEFISDAEYKSGKHKDEKKWKYSLKRGFDKATQVELTRRGIPYMTIKDIIKAGVKWFVNPQTEKITKRKGLRLL